MRSRSTKLHELISSYWQPTIFYGMLIVFFGMLLWFQLGTLVGGYSGSEINTLHASRGLHYILDHPLNAPFTITTYLLQHLPFIGHGPFATRATATIFALLTLTTFYWLIRYWHGERTAILGTILFGCSAWFLHTARFGAPQILLFLVLSLAAASVWLRRTDNRILILAGFAFVGAMLYVPGMPWLIGLGALWQIKTIFRLFKEHYAVMAIGVLLLLILLSPLGWAIFREPETARVLVGLPAHGWPSPIGFLKSVAEIPYSLVWRGPLDATHWLARLPVLGAFSIAMLVFGVYLYARHWRLMRSQLMLAGIVIGVLLIGMGGAVTSAILAPLIYTLIAAGMGFMLDRWHKVFPRNVIAQTVGIGLVSVAVVASSWYGLRHYFVAWPNTQATREVFTNK